MSRGDYVRDEFFGQTDLIAVLDLGDRLADAADDLLTFGLEVETSTYSVALRKMVSQWDEMRRNNG